MTFFDKQRHQILVGRPFSGLVSAWSCYNMKCCQIWHLHGWSGAAKGIQFEVFQKDHSKRQEENHHHQSKAYKDLLKLKPSRILIRHDCLRLIPHGHPASGHRMLSHKVIQPISRKLDRIFCFTNPPSPLRWCHYTCYIPSSGCDRLFCRPSLDAFVAMINFKRTSPLDNWTGLA